MSTAPALTAPTSEQQPNGNGAVVPRPAPPKTPIVAGDRGVQLRSLDDMYRFACCVHNSGLAPKGIETPEAIMVAIQMGAELGLTPMASLQNIAVINGRPSVWGDAMLGVCRASGLFDEEAFEERFEGQGDILTAICTVRRLPRGKPVTRPFSIADASAAELLTKSGPWKQYRRRMLQMRARSWALRDAFSDILRGFKCAEEAWDTIDVPAVDPHTAPAKTLDALAEQLVSAPQAAPLAPAPAPAFNPSPVASASAAPSPAEPEIEPTVHSSQDQATGGPTILDELVDAVKTASTANDLEQVRQWIEQAHDREQINLLEKNKLMTQWGKRFQDLHKTRRK